ncbi:MAG: hypothetical protein N2Z73_03670 [Endomicrobia bacterium]|nr:hypothetical protein [Endomicrobiia bacterium]
MPRRRAIKDLLKDVSIKPEIESEDKELKITEETQEVKSEIPESLSFVIPANKAPIQLKEMQVGDEVTVQVVGNISSSDETGITIDVKTIEVV